MAVLLAASLLSAQDQGRFRAIQDRAIDHSPAFTWLQELTDSVGARLTGSTEAAMATQWALLRMQTAGLKNIHLEPWQLREGWKRGYARAEMTAPTGATRADSLGVYAQRPVRVRAAQLVHAVAVIARESRPGTMLVHTDPVVFGDASYKIPVLDIAAEHQKQIERMLTAGRPVRLRVAVSNTFTAGPVESANVVGEIPGTEHPEQVVILAAHLDSWDLGTGAIDDGYGVAAVLGAVESIAGAGARPKRTIRTVLFTGEEQGLLGSRAWVQQHKAELGNVVCVLALDWGQGAITSLPLAGRSDLAEEFKELPAVVNGIQPFAVDKGYLSFTDAYSFTLAGVPGLAFLQNSPQYSLEGHSAADTLDKVDAQTLRKNAAVVAVTAFWIADHPRRLGSQWTREQTAARLTEDGQRPMLAALGLWSF